MRFGARSYRTRIPLSLVAVAMGTALALSMVMAYETYLNVQVDNLREGRRLAHAMIPVLRQALKHEDVWQAYEILRGPAAGPQEGSAVDARRFVLVDKKGLVFASNHPLDYPVARPVGPLLPGPNGFSWPPGEQPVTRRLDHWQMMVAPILSEDEVIGHLLVLLPRAAYWDRFIEIVRGGALVMLLVLAVVLPIGWIWGRRMVAPLARLSQCMARVGRDDLREIQCSIATGDDEIGTLGRRFREMLQGLRQKEALERQMVSQERLAAVGRVAAGVAHEINNPVGGLLVAIDTYRHTPLERRQSDKTLDFIERGLRQVQEAMQALLVESRLETRALQPQDIDDVQRLIQAESATRERRLHWHNRLSGPVALPAGSVRQILLNLALNAVQATGPGQRVEVVVEPRDAALVVEVVDEGPGIPQHHLERLFEPFNSGRAGGTGLGLWVTYQTVTQLRGEIEVTSEEGRTRFLVRLPLGEGGASHV